MSIIQGYYLTPQAARFHQVNEVLPEAKFSLSHAASLSDLQTLAASRAPDFLLCDLPLPDKPDLQALDMLQTLFSQPVVMLGDTASRGLKSFVLQRGAAYLERSLRGLKGLPNLLEGLNKSTNSNNAAGSDPCTLILEHLSDCVWLFDLNLRPLYINPNTPHRLGYSLEELQAMPLAKQMTPASLEQLSAALAEVLSPDNLRTASSSDALRPLELELFRKSGSNIYTEAKLNLVRDARGIANALLIVYRDISTRKESEKLQNAVFEIAQLTYSAQNLSDLYKSIHQILGRLMRADNFYIALYNSDSQMVEFPYFVDEFDPPPPPHPFGHGLTEYVIRTGKPVLASPQLFDRLYSENEVESVGSVSFDWLGVPLNVHGKTIGMMAVQTYSEGKRYTIHDLDILTFVSNQVATVLERKRIEEISNRYAAIANNAGELMSLIDRNYIYSAVNDAFCQRNHRTRDEVVGHSVMELWGEDTFKNGIKGWLDRCFNGETGHNEAWFDFKGHYYGYYKVAYYPYRAQSGEITHAIVITHDITKHKLSENALQHRLEMEQLAATISSRLINIPGVQMDTEIEQSLQMMGEFIKADRSFLNWFSSDLKRNEKRMEWCAHGIEPRNPRFLKQETRKSPNYMKQLLNGETIILSPQTSNDPEVLPLRDEGLLSVLILPLSDSGSLFGTLGFETLNTERAWLPEDIELLKVIGQAIAGAQRRRSSEQALARERNLLRTLIDNIPDMIYLKDTNLRFRVVNAALQQALGANAEQEILGKTDYAYFPEQQADQFNKDDRAVLAGTPLINREELSTNPNQQQRWILTTKIPIHNEEGKIDGLLGIERDISERKRAEEAMRHRLALETEVAVISARFIKASPEQIDAEIYSALEALGKLSQMDCCYVYWLNHRQDQIIQAIQWHAQQKNQDSLLGASNNLALYPWLNGRLRRGEIIHAPRINELPKEAQAEKEICRKLGIKSMIAIPVISGGLTLGMLGFQTEEREHTWLPEDIQMLRLVSEIVGNAEQQKRTSQALARRNAILEAMNSAAGQFLSPIPLSEAIQNTIQRFGEAAQVSRVYLFKILPSNDGKTHITQTHEWTAKGITGQMDNPALANICLEDQGYSRWRDLLSHGETVHGDISAFPQEEADRLQEQDIHSILIVPIFVNQRWWGFIGFDECKHVDREWLDAEREALRTAASLVGSGLLRQQTEDELRESELKFRSVISQSVDGITLTDQNGILIEWNQGQETITGIKREDVLGRPVWEVMHRLAGENRQSLSMLEIARQSVLDTLKKRQENWPGMQTTHKIQRSDGSVRLMQSTSFLIETPQGVMLGGSNRDITNEKEAEERLRDSEQRFRAVFENAGIGITLLSAEGKILQSNPSLQKMLGYNQEELQSMTLADITHPEDYPREEKRIQRAISRRHSNISYNTERRFLRKDGSVMWGLLSATTIFDGNGNPIHGLGLVQDISERKHTEGLIRETQEQLAERVRELESNAQQIALLSELSNMLQLSSNAEEVFGGITRYGSQIFPGLEGAFFLLDDKKRNLHLRTSWGSPVVSDQSLLREDCWAIRRVRPYLVTDLQRGLLCHHIGEPRPASSICLPVTIQSQVVGLLNLQSLTPAQNLTIAQQQFAAALAEQIGLTLSNIELRKSMNQMIIQDPLTGLYNRLYMDEALNRELQRSKSVVAVVKFDVDNLTHINSIYGFMRGDSLLREIGTLLKNLLRPIDIACRTGGDEFIIILPEVGLEYAIAKVDDLRQHLENLKLPDQDLTTLSITISCGIAIWPNNGLSASDLILAAENTLHRAKQKGGNCIEVA